MKKGTNHLGKFRLLARRLAKPDWQVIGMLEAMWLFAQAEAPTGELGTRTDKHIAAGMDMELSEWIAFRDAAICEGWLDIDSRRRFVIHDWEDHAPEWLRKQMARGGLSCTPGDGIPPPAAGSQRRTMADNGGQRPPPADNGGPPLSLDPDPVPRPSLNGAPSAPPLGLADLERPSDAARGRGVGLQAAAEFLGAVGGGGASPTPHNAPTATRIDPQSPTKTTAPAPEWCGDVSEDDRRLLLEAWNTGLGRPASRADLRALVPCLDRVVAAHRFNDSIVRAPVSYLIDRARAYVGSCEATRDRGAYKTTLKRFLETDKWLESDGAWQYVRPAPESAADAAKRRMGIA